MSATRLVVRASIPLVLAALAPLAAAQHAQAEPSAVQVPRFRLTLLPAPAEALSTSATAINEQGQIAGTLISVGGFGALVQTAFWPAPDAQPTVASGLSADNSQASDLNEAGSVVGNGTDPGEGYVAFTWVPGQDLEPVADVAGVSCLVLYAIGDRGAAVGIGTFPGLGTRPTRWVNGVPEDLGVLPGDTEGAAFGLSDAGHIVGRSGYRAARWFQGAIEQLTFTGGSSGAAVALAVNARGEAVGDGYPGPDPVPVLWRSVNGIPLPTLGGASGTAAAINERSWIVGMSQTAPPYAEDGNQRATLWIGLQAFDLNTLTLDRPDDVVLARAFDLNDAGQIVGVAQVGDAPLARGFLLEPAQR